jgi:hypothetical protein
VPSGAANEAETRATLAGLRARRPETAGRDALPRTRPECRAGTLGALSSAAAHRAEVAARSGAGFRTARSIAGRANVIAAACIDPARGAAGIYWVQVAERCDVVGREDLLSAGVKWKQSAFRGGCVPDTFRRRRFAELAWMQQPEQVTDFMRQDSLGVESTLDSRRKREALQIDVEICFGDFCSRGGDAQLHVSACPATVGEASFSPAFVHELYAELAVAGPRVEELRLTHVEAQSGALGRRPRARRGPESFGEERIIGWTPRRNQAHGDRVFEGQRDDPNGRIVGKGSVGARRRRPANGHAHEHSRAGVATYADTNAPPVAPAHGLRDPA